MNFYNLLTVNEIFSINLFYKLSLNWANMREIKKIKSIYVSRYIFWFNIFNICLTFLDNFQIKIYSFTKYHHFLKTLFSNKLIFDMFLLFISIFLNKENLLAWTYNKDFYNSIVFIYSLSRPSSFNQPNYFFIIRRKIEKTNHSCSYKTFKFLILRYFYLSIF